MKRGQTTIEKIISKNLGSYVYANDTVWLKPDLITARDFAGPNAVLKFEEEFQNQPVFNPEKILFTFDCGHDLKYSINQDIVRKFAEKQKIKISEVDHGIGTHILIQKGLAYPGQIITGTDSHFGILGAVNALGIAAGDTQTAFALKTGLLEYTVPETIKVSITGKYEFPTSAKDLALYILTQLGAKGALGKALEFSGETINNLDLAGRITLASLGAEMSASAVLIHPNKDVLKYSRRKSKIKKLEAILADENASYSGVIYLDASRLTPQAARPGNPRDVIPVSKLNNIKINQVLIGSCTNSTYEDIARAAYILQGKKIKQDVRFYIVPGTEETYKNLVKSNLVKVLTDAGAIVYPASCAGCTSEQVGKLGLNTVAVDTGNRNFTKKQGPGKKYLVSPETAAASALEGKITSAENFRIPSWLYSYKGKYLKKSLELKLTNKKTSFPFKRIEYKKPTTLSGKAWIIGNGLELFDNVDTDAIYHNSRLTITNPKEMGKYTFEQFEAYKPKEYFFKKFQAGDIIIVGENFGCGSSREHAVKCFMSLGASLIIGKSFAPVYKTNAETLGFPLIECPNIDHTFVIDREQLQVNIQTGEIKVYVFKVKGKALTKSAMTKYQAGGLFGLAK